MDSATLAIMTCVATGAYKSNITITQSHAHCPDATTSTASGSPAGT
jgi:hypothetical protein